MRDTKSSLTAVVALVAALAVTSVVGESQSASGVYADHQGAGTSDQAKRVGVSNDGQGSQVETASNLIYIEVVALDSKRKPLKALTRESFKLYVDDREQEIASFGIVEGIAGVPTPSTTPTERVPQLRHGKVVMILFDDSTTSSMQSKVVHEAAEKYVRKNMRPGDQIGVAVFRQNLQVRSPAIRRLLLPRSVSPDCPPPPHGRHRAR
jgi:hypothetical protein